LPQGYTYASYQQAAATQIPTTLTDPNFLIELPNAIDYGELSLYRDLDFLSMKGFQSLGNTAIGTNSAGLPVGVIAVESAYYAPGAGELAPLCPMSIDAITAIYGALGNGIPTYYAVVGGANGSPWTAGLNLLLGPTPNAIYPLSAYCSQRAAPLSATNTTTFISQNLPDVFWAATMIYWSSVMKNFGAASDQPQMAVSWEQEYKRLIAGAKTEQDRLKQMSQGWQSMPPATLAQPRT
jgi:hypothetical protein